MYPAEIQDMHITFYAGHKMWQAYDSFTDISFRYFFFLPTSWDHLRQRREIVGISSWARDFRSEVAKQHDVSLVMR